MSFLSRAFSSFGWLKLALKPDKYSLIALGVGVVSVFGFAPFEFSFATLAALVGIFWLWTKAESFARAAHYGLLFGLGQFGLGVSWLFSSIYFHSGTGLVLAVLLVFLFVLLLALFVALAGVLIKIFFDAEKPGRALIFLMPASWVAIELLRSKILGGLPFLPVGLSHLGTWLDGYAPVLGVYGVSFILAMTAGLLVWFLVYKQQVIAAILIMLIWSSGGVLHKRSWVEPAGNPVKIALVQGNIPQAEKWDAQKYVPSMQSYINLTRASLDSQIIVWPETAIPVYFDQAANGVLKQFVADVKLQSRDIVVGAITREADGSYYNSLLNLKDGQEYRKRHLVMFGEYYPFGSLLEKVAQWLDFPFSQFSAGASGSQVGVLELAGHKVGASICFETMFGSELARDLPDAKFLISASNDDWFARTFEPAQLRQESQMRALELGRQMARVSNTGFTNLIDEKGKLVAEIAPYEAGVLKGKIQPLDGLTPFARFGNFPVFLMIFLVFAVILGKRYVLRGVKFGA